MFFMVSFSWIEQLCTYLFFSSLIQFLFFFLGTLVPGSVSHPRCLPSAEAVLAMTVVQMGTM